MSQQPAPPQPVPGIPTSCTMNISSSFVISYITNQGVINLYGNHSQDVQNLLSGIKQKEDQNKSQTTKETEKYQTTNQEKISQKSCDHQNISEINEMKESQPTEEEYLHGSDPELSTVTSILKSMESDLTALIKKEKTITETVNQLTESKKTLKSPSQVQDLHEQVESNEKMLEKVSSEFGRLKSFSVSMSEMVRPQSRTNGHAQDGQVTTKIPSLEEMEVQPVIGQLKFQKKIVEWTNMRNYRILYRSSKDGLSARSLNARICGRSNILIIVLTTKGYVFGSFSSIQIPPPPRLGDLHVGADPNFFVYSFQNPFNTEPLKILKKNSQTSMKIYCNKEQSYVIGCDCCFYIRSNCPCHVPSNFCDNYNEPSGKGNLLFVNCVYPEKFALQELLAVELSD
ncbi:hypothetical protein EHI8A_095990 [Entamoeba histolytica HM-1:IMSS-B]|uniref:TLDc domain-containing protein n=6 Tax=Entamoeba histolytica TaxID=5759 RepID=C4M6Q7_ENTH1|nr:hypothetical protein EHI_201280 [Entamoeba histolytica HM-1:IMSS]EMD49142.1 Hypothetical protein EHI5A_130260 [Entamoeba histolytica KU27]EMH75865.1 hypothetical protein EHI8A_095990 [Entamoeba histolytica HM-1:IMSS-B]EMS17302.1 hypothetical protein KM1_168350 [Entamoeba histolytica HM-3:IMSS]ENY63311.1 hypothetical protein EHI7A_092550 [Entamoeba histolytica HM-1:IMSS-A]GAT97179.1 hypothetical protein CL6EHI_201280 [Entamoeba histolytica]|eukprot:XP_652000.1 hypothetical protein EHI_201280 [Entamoeba histolytica HM-1:IMSS]